ncbi:nickel pincer cofactor biosynthesis protein LarC [Thermodesulfobacteriota bacterium]
MKTAYLDCFSGISGDMFLGALLDAGLSYNKLKQHLTSLPVKNFEINVKKEKRNGILGTRLMVEDKSKSQIPRNLKDIEGLINKANLDQAVKDKSIEIFSSLAEIEGRVHGLPIDEVHFHEVGAVDSIIDVVGTVFGIKALGIGSLFVSPLPLGSGFVQTDHGRIPVPAPATIALLKDVPISDSGVQHEMVTPTGAALVKGLAASFGRMPSMVVENIGYGTGSRDLPDRPNLVRILIGRDSHENETDFVAVLETNIDDANPEWLGFLMERLFSSGALDVTFSSVQMKKNRPGVNIKILTRPELKDILANIVMTESTAIGVRFSYCQRKVLKRTEAEIESPWGKMTVKKVFGINGSSHFLPEYEACRKIALKNNIALKEIYSWIMALNKKE